MMKFPLGQIVATPGALEALGDEPTILVTDLIGRHAAGDWGDLDADDRAANDRAAQEGGRILSAYRLTDGANLWVITEADRSSTTILLPEEY